MDIIPAILCGAVWGFFIAWINSLITRSSLKKTSANAALTANFCRMLLDVLALGIVFLLRKILPFSFEAALIATAVTLSVMTIINTFILAKEIDKKEQK